MTAEEQVYFREVAVAYLRVTFAPPLGYGIDALEAEYNGTRFPVIVLGWHCDPEPLSLNERHELIRRIIDPLNRFVQSVDWQEIGRIRVDAAHAPGVEDLKRLLERHAATVPLAQHCLDALLDSAADVHVAPKPLDAAPLRDYRFKVSGRYEAEDKVWGISVESSEQCCRRFPEWSRRARRSMSIAWTCRGSKARDLRSGSRPPPLMIHNSDGLLADVPGNYTTDDNTADNFISHYHWLNSVDLTIQFIRLVPLRRQFGMRSKRRAFAG